MKRIIKYWKPNLIQRMLIKLGVIKYPRYNGKKKKKFLADELGYGILKKNKI